MKNAILILLAIQALTLSAIAQDYSADQNKGRKKNFEVEKQEPTSTNKEFIQQAHEFGIASGFTTGYGLSYRYWPKKVGFQLTTYPSISNDKKNFCVGLTSLIELDARRWYRFFVFVGGNFIWTQNPNHEDFVNDVFPASYLFNLNAPKEEQKRYTAGFGPGIEFTPGKHFGINLMTGFRYYYLDYAIEESKWASTLTADVAIYFRF